MSEAIEPVSLWAAWVNASPCFINNFTIAVGFGVTLRVGDYISTALAVNPAHPIFNVPFGPVGSSFSGGYLTL